MFVFFSSRRQHTRCALGTVVQTCALPISGHARLMDRAADRMRDQFLVAFPARTAEIDLRDQYAVVVERIGVDAGEGADAAGLGPGPEAFAVGNGNALAA